MLTAPAEIAADAKTALEGLGKYFGLVTDIFLRMIKMIIAPLVFATLVSGIVHMGDTAALGRVGAKTIIWFLGATVVSLTLGAVLVNFIQPGAGGGFTLPPADATAGIVKPDSDIFKIIAEMFPRSIVEGMANNTILQIVIFSLFFGVAMTAIGEKAAPIARGVDALVDVVVGKYAPLPATTLSHLVSRLVFGAPQWQGERAAALRRAKARLASAASRRLPCSRPWQRSSQSRALVSSAHS